MKFVVLVVISMISFAQARSLGLRVLFSGLCSEVATALVTLISIREVLGAQTRDGVLSGRVDRLQELTETRSRRPALLNARFGPSEPRGSRQGAISNGAGLAHGTFGGVILSSHIVIVILGAVYCREAIGLTVDRWLSGMHLQETRS